MEGSAEVRVIEVIEVKVLRGRGTRDLHCDCPIRTVTQYFNREGELLAEKDDFCPVRYVNGRGVWQFVEGGQEMIEPKEPDE